MPNTEPNTLPAPFDNWDDWRAVYEDRVSTFKSGRQGRDALYELTAALQRLGYAGTNLQTELNYIQGH